MKNMPGMGNLGEMMSSMGIPGLGKKTKLNMGAMQSKLDQNIRMSKTRERMKMKLEERKKERSLQEEVNRLKAELAATNVDTRTTDEIIAEIDSMPCNKSNSGNNDKKQVAKKKKKKKKR